MEPIAIIGTSFKLPQGADDELAFWDMLQNARNTMTPWPASRVNIDAFYSPNRSKMNSVSARGGHFILEDLATFDAPFFSITAKEAASMDVQQRWLLEMSYWALENAGIPVEKIAGTQTGVFSASIADDYCRMIVRDPEEAPMASATGTNPSILANRLSWYFDLKGPSMQMNTACSSAMIALDTACQSLRNGQSSMALVTGSNVLLTIQPSLHLSNMGFLSPDSVCYSFDHRANGYGRGEGYVVILLKKLCDAVRDGNMIRAVIQGVGSNQDGHTPSFTQPNGLAQEALIRKVYQDFNLDFGLTHYVEAHGTGTQIGDQTELTALGKVFRASHSSSNPLYIGSVKSNIGHLEGGSGLAGVLKCISILERGVIPPSANFEKLNPNINAKRLNIQIPTSSIQWPGFGLRRVSVNSFGFGGSNGHAVLDDAYHTLELLSLRGIHRTLLLALENSDRTLSVKGDHLLNGERIGHPMNENYKITGDQDINAKYPTAANGTIVQHTTSSVSRVDPTCKLLVWSTKDETSLRKMIQNYEEYFEKRIAGFEGQLDCLAFTLSSKRSIMPWKTYSVAGYNNSSLPPIRKPIRSSRKSGLAFVFTGQGAQYQGMGLELIKYPVFKQALLKANSMFHDLGAEWTVFDALNNAEIINRPDLSQPLSTALQIALVDLLRSLGIVPSAVIGHSSGEIAAAYTIGALSFGNACMIAYHRGRLAARLVASKTRTPGAMMSVNLPEGDVSDYLKKIDMELNLSVACINSPVNVTLSGDEKDIDLLKVVLDNDNIFAKKVTTGVAYHSAAMQAIATEYHESISMGNLEEPSDLPYREILMVSSVTGVKTSPTRTRQAQYWVDNLVSPVRFAEALTYLMLEAPITDRLKEITDFVEVGPHGALRRPVGETISQATGRTNHNYISCLTRFESSLNSLLQCAGHLFTLGYPVNVAAVNQQDSDGNALQFLIDTPQYPFDHSQTYWHESRYNRDWRLRGGSEGILLGKRASDWNSLRPRWRKFLSLEDTPWAADHVIEQSIFFPGTGILMIAIEAVSQSIQGNKLITGYQVKEATFINPIVIKPNSRTEIETQLRPLLLSYEKSATRFEVQIFCRVQDDWVECFHSILHAELEESPLEIDNEQARQTANQHLMLEFERSKRDCDQSIDKTKFYAWLRSHNLKYGPAFSLAQGICWDGDRLGMAEVDVSALAESFDGLVHPAILDAACQICFTAPSRGMSKSLPTLVPHKLKGCWISASGWKYPNTTRVRILTTLTGKETLRGLHSSCAALDDHGKLLWRIKHLEMLPVGGGETESGDQRELLYYFDWKPQLSLLSPHQLNQYCQSDIRDKSRLECYDRFNQAVQATLQHKMEELLQVNWKVAPHYSKKYVEWMEHLLERNSDTPRKEISEHNLRVTLQGLREENPAWALVVEVAQNLLPLVRGDIDALEKLPSLVNHFHDELVKFAYGPEMIKFIQLAAHENPTQRILEINAGSGQIASLIIPTLQQIGNETGGITFSEYIYTDTSSEFFEVAKSKFGGQESHMTYKVLNLKEDIVSQGFEPGAYDIVILNGVVQATNNHAFALRNIRTVLKSGGHIILHQSLDPNNIITAFTLGMAPGWREANERNRTACSILTATEWHKLLNQEGFTGNDLLVDNVTNMSNFLISTTQPVIEIPTTTPEVLLVIEHGIEYQARLASAITSILSGSLCWQPRTILLEQLDNPAPLEVDNIIFLADMGSTLLRDMSSITFMLLQHLIQKSRNLLWPTESGAWEDTQTPYCGLKDGFLRTMRAEFNTKCIISLTIQGGAKPDPLVSAEHIIKVFRASASHLSCDVEYVVRNNWILTSRLVQATEENRELHASIRPVTKVEPWLPGMPLKLGIAARGSLETLQFVRDAEFDQPLAANEVEMEAKVWGVNFRDMFLALGRLYEEGFGVDGAGVVTKVGSDCTLIKPGDRVYMCRPGNMKMYPRAAEGATIRIPDEVSLEEACSVLTPFLTAWYSLIHRAGIEKGEKVLIHAASGGTGQLAIQVAQMVGAEVFATVGYEYKKQLLIDHYGIPEDHIFYSRNTSFAEGIMRATSGYGVDVVLNCISGEGLRASWELVAPYGRFVEIGKADINGNSPLPMGCFAGNVSYLGVDLRHLALFKKGAEKKLLSEGMDFIRQGKIHTPQPLKVYELCDTESALRSFQSGKNAGRVLISIEPNSNITTCLLRQSHWSYAPDATYLISGGFGGLGRAILRWMVSKGARNLIVPSRSGPVSPAAAQLVQELREAGTTIVTPRCDVSSSRSLLEVIQQCSNMPPIRGCINASMVLNDSILDNMSYQQWNQTVRSKVQTSWNLHNLLPSDMDFFILLSSISGVVGNISQSNYAAGCTFQDSLAEYRQRLGQKGFSIDLGAMRTIGIISETDVLQKNFEESLIFNKIEEEEFLALLDIYCDPKFTPNQSQVAVGIKTPADALARNLDPPESILRPAFAYFSLPRDGLFPGLNRSNSRNLSLLFRQAKTNDERSSLVVEALSKKLARALSMQPGDIDSDNPIHAYGVDSLVAVELRNWLGMEFSSEVPVHEILSGKTIIALGNLVANTSTIALPA